MQQQQGEATTIEINNNSAIAIVRNPTSHVKTKHIEMNFHLIHDLEKANEATLSYCETENQLEDIFTKDLSQVRFEFLRNKLGVSRRNLEEECHTNLDTFYTYSSACSVAIY